MTKPSYDEWLRWGQVIVDRLTACVHVYSKPPFSDVFMADRDRQNKNARALGLLRQAYALTDEAETADSAPNPTPSDVQERIIAGLDSCVADALEALPEISADMQKLLKSPWVDNCNGKIADMLFIGLSRDGNEGIGSGYPDHGRLPAALLDLQERERLGDVRAPRHVKSSGGGEKAAAGEEAPRRGPMHPHSYRQTAGRVE